MCWRQVSKLQKTVLIVLFYLTIYLLISYAISPETSYTFVRDDLRVGHKYALVFLVSPQMPVFSDAEGADVFRARHCSGCFLTNNRGFLPMAEYDAILVHDDRTILFETSAFMDPDKRFLIETSKKCIRNKLRGCNWEPKITAIGTRKTFDLCQLCRHLREKRMRPQNS